MTTTTIHRHKADPQNCTVEETVTHEAVILWESNALLKRRARNAVCRITELFE